MPAISRLFFEIGGDKSKLDQSLREAVESAKAAGLEVTRSGQSIIAAFNQALNPTKRLGEEIKLLEAAGRSSSDIWKVYGDRMTSAAEAARRNGQAVDPLITKHLDLNAATRKSIFSLSELSASFGTVQKAMLGMGLAFGATQIISGLINIGKASVRMAMDAVESENLFAVSMGRMANETAAWSKQISHSLGLNEYEVRKNVGTFNVMFTAMGIGTDKAYEMSKGLTQLSYDFSSFYNLRPEEAFDKIRAGISGEMEPLKRLGIVLDEASVKTYAYSHGIGKLGEELTQQEKVLARYGLLLEQTSAAQGDLGRTIDSPANQLRLLESRTDALQTTLGMAFLPVIQSVVSELTALTNAGQTTNEGLQYLAKVVAAPVMGFMTLMRTLNEARLQLAEWNLALLDLNPFTPKEDLRRAAQEIRDAAEATLKWNEKIEKLEQSVANLGKFNYDAAKAARDLEQSQSQSTAVIKKQADEIEKLTNKGWKIYLEGIKDRTDAAAEATKALTLEYRNMGDELERAWRADIARRNAAERENAPLSSLPIALPGLDEIHRVFEKVRDEQQKSYEEMSATVRKETDGLFDAITSRGKGAFTELGDWIEGIFLSRLKRLFGNLILSITNGFKGGLAGLLQGVVPGIPGIGGISGTSSLASAGMGILGTMGTMGLMVPGNAAIKTAAALGSGLFGGAGMISAGLVPGIGGSFGASLSYLSSGAGLFGSGGLFGLGAMTMPLIGGAIAAGTYGIPKLIGAIRGKTSEEAGAKEVTRDLGIGYGKDAFAQFYQSLGLTESSSYGIRRDLIMSPKFLVEQALPIAEATGKMDELLTKLGKAGFRDAFELGRATGDWSELNRQFKEAFQNSTNLWKNLPDWQTELMAPAAHVKTEIEILTDSLTAMRDALLASVTPIQTIYDKFMATGEITAEFAAQIEKAGGSIEKFRDFANLNLQVAGLQQSLGFIESLASSLKGLAPELDPIQQILSGTIGPEAFAALTAAGLDPSRFSGLSSLIGMQKSFGGFKPFQSLTPELRQALSQYGGEEGRLAIERYGQGFNTIAEDLLASTKAAMDQAYQGAIKDALSYLGDAQKETSDKISELIKAIDESKMSIVEVLNRILLSLSKESSSQAQLSPMEQYARDYQAWQQEGREAMEEGGAWGYLRWKVTHPEPKPPSLDSGGIVVKSGIAEVHAGEEFSGVGKSLRQPVQIIFNNASINKWDDFVQMVHRANIELKMVGA